MIRRKTIQEETESATRIQAIRRGRKVRQEILSQQKDTEESAATVLQARQRGRAARAALEDTKIIRDLTQSQYLSEVDSFEHQKRERAVAERQVRNQKLIERRALRNGAPSPKMPRSMVPMVE